MPALAVTLLGTGTVLPSATRGCTSSLLRTEQTTLLLDCGPGTKDRLARAGLGLGSLDEILFTHLHLDHCLDLFILLFYRLHPQRGDCRPLRLTGPPGFGAWLEAAAEALYPGLLGRQPELSVGEVQPREVFDCGDLIVRSVRAVHAWPSLSYRLETRGATVVFSGDTGPSERLAELAAGVDLLVCECAFGSASEAPVHMHPAAVRSLADAARPAELVLTHLYPEVAATLPGPAFADYPGSVQVAFDGMRIELNGETSDRAEVREGEGDLG